MAAERFDDINELLRRIQATGPKPEVVLMNPDTVDVITDVTCDGFGPPKVTKRPLGSVVINGVEYPVAFEVATGPDD